MSVLPYQEVTRRIEELTRSIYALDPYFVMPPTPAEADDSVATLSMLVSTADHARANRRARSPERRDRRKQLVQLATLTVPDRPPRAKSPAWVLGGTTYAEIVKGHGSRSSSIGSRQPSTQRQTSAQRRQYEFEQTERSTPITDVNKYSEKNVNVQPCVQCEPADITAYDSEEYSESRVCEKLSESVSVRDEDIYYSEQYGPNVTQDDKTYMSDTPKQYLEEGVPIKSNNIFIEKFEAQSFSNLLPPEEEVRASSPGAFNRSPDLSYAEILALGLRKQPKVHSIMSLPKPQIAEVQLVKEIVVEVENSPLVQHEPTFESTDKTRTKQERPPQRSRSRDMPRQRRAPEKRTTKSHDVQVMKKKKTSRKVIEVQDFEDIDITSDTETLPRDKELSNPVSKGTKVDKSTKENLKQIQHSSTVVETIPEYVDLDQPQVLDNIEHKKSKKKQKSKKPKSAEDEIQQALREIEESEKQKKKKSKDQRDKSKDDSNKITTPVIADHEIVTETKESIIKPKKKTILDVSQDTLKNVTTGFITSESTSESSENVKYDTNIMTEDISKSYITDTVTESPTSNEKIVPKSKKKKKNKNHDKVSDDKAFDSTATEKASLTEETNIIMPVLEKAPNIVQQIEETTPQTTKPESKQSIYMTEVETTTDAIFDDDKDNITKTDVAEQRLDEEQPVQVKSNKKKSKSRKQKDDDIEKALREIEQSDATKKKSKSKSGKNKESLQKHSIFKDDIKIEKVEQEIHGEKRDLDLPEKDIPEKETSIKIDWNDLIAQEESVTLPTLEPISAQQGYEVNIDTAVKQASEVTILEETKLFFVQKSDTVNKKEDGVDTSQEIIQTSIEKSHEPVDEQSRVFIASLKDTKTNQETKLLEDASLTMSSPSNEQNNNDKFFLSDKLKEGSINIVEQVTRYEPIEKDIETRTIYLITHEEKKLPPIRTVKVFTSKSNSLEDTSFDESISDVVDKPSDNKITNEKSSTSSIDKDNILTADDAELKTTIDEISFTSEDQTSGKQNSSHKATPTVNVTSPSTNLTEFEIEDVSQYEELQGRISDEISKVLTENELSDIVEEAIFGSVQDRSRSEKSKYENIPYTELKEEIKTYSVDLDMTQLEQMYYQYYLQKQNYHTEANLPTDIQGQTQFTDELSQNYENVPGNALENSENNKSSLETLQEYSCATEISQFSPKKEESPKIIYKDVEKTLKDHELQASDPIDTNIKQQCDLFEENKNSTTLTGTIISSDTVRNTTTSTLLDMQTGNLIDSASQETPQNLEISGVENIIAEPQTPEKTCAVELPSAHVVDVNEIMEQEEPKKENAIYEVPRYSYHEIVDAETLLASTQHTVNVVTEPLLKIEPEKFDEPEYIDQKEDDITLEKPIVSYQEIQDADIDIIMQADTKSKEVEESSSITDTLENYNKNKQLDLCSSSKNNLELLTTLNEMEKETLPDNNISAENSNFKLYDVPKYSYHEINDAENLFASSRPLSQGEINTENYEVDTDEVFNVEANTDNIEQKVVFEKITQPLLLDTFNVTHIDNNIRVELPRHNYQDIRDAENVLAEINTETEHLQKISTVSVEGNETFDRPDIKSNHEEENNIINEIDLMKRMNSEKLKTVQKIDQNINPHKEKLKVVESNSDIDNFENISIVREISTAMDKEESIDLNKFESSDDEFVFVEKPLEDQIRNVSFEVDDLDESLVPIIFGNVRDIVEKPLEDQIRNVSFKVDDLDESLVPIIFGNVKDIVEKPLEDQIRNVSFEVDDLDESLVPIIFGNVKDIIIPERNEDENFSEFNTTANISEEIIFDEQSSSTEAVSPSVKMSDEIPSEKITEEISSDMPDNIPVAAYIKSDLPLTPLTISAESGQIENISHLRSELNDTPKDIVRETSVESLDISTNITDSIILEQTNVNQTITNDSNTTRIDKSPIHSLHELLPEIDSIPEFKPLYSNTVLYSNLSADAPEFTPSYMYQSIPSTVLQNDPEGSSSQLPTEESVTQKVNVSDEKYHTEPPVIDTIKTTKVTYSSVLEIKKEKQEDSQNKNIIETVNTNEPVSISEDVEIKHKRTKKKKSHKKETAPIITTEPAKRIETQILDEPVNVWIKAADDGKSYAEVVAEGLVLSQETRDQETLNLTEPSSKLECVTEPIFEQDEYKEIKEDSPENLSVIGSWAKIVATQRSSPERVQKIETEQEISTQHPKQAPVILVDVTYEPSKCETEVDSEGFITVERHRRSRSRSRDNRSRSISNMSQKQEVREKSENRFDALASPKLDLNLDTQESLSRNEKPENKKELSRKHRTSKSKEKEIVKTDEDIHPKKNKKKRSSQIKLKESDLDTGDSINQIILDSQPENDKEEKLEKTIMQVPPADSKKKGKKKKKNQKSENLPTDAVKSSLEAIDVCIETSNVVTEDKSGLTTPMSNDSSPIDTESSVSNLIPEIDVAPLLHENVQGASDLSTLIVAATKEISPVQITLPTVTKNDHVSESIEVINHVEKDVPILDEIASQVSTPDSQQTPIKDRLFSEAQFWKVDPDDLKDLSEVMTIEILHPEKQNDHGTIPMTNIKNTDMSYEKNDNIRISTTEFITEETKAIAKSQENINIQKENISEEESLEDQMADLQREIEELLLPENDLSLGSDESPRELVDTQTSAEYQNDDISDTISPILASPEPEPSDILIENRTMVLEKNSVDDEPIEKVETKDVHISENKISSLLADTDILPILPKEPEVIMPEFVPSEILQENRENHNTSAFSQFETIESSDLTLTSNSEFFTNNLSNLKTENFWTEKFMIDDAERLLNENKSEPIKPLVRDSEILSDNNCNVEENIRNDDRFWLEKHLYHDAECRYFLLMAKKPKTVETSKIETEFIDRDDKDKDPSGSSGHSSETEESKDFSGSPFDSNYISMDLPGGICSWKDHSSFLSLETPTDSLTVLSDHALQLDDIREDILTTSPLEPVAPSQPSQEPAGEEGPRRTAKDELSNDIESLLEEVRNIQTRLSDLPDESLQAMEDGLREGITVLVKCEEAADLLETKIMEYRQEAEVQVLMKDLIIMKARISKLLTQARQGLDIIQDAKAEVARQTKEIEEHKEKITKLDKWLENINGELKESTKQADVVNEDDIIRYIEIYERYIREYDEYEIILKSITVISQDESSQSLREKLSAMQKALADTKSLVIIEIERLRQVLLHMRSLPEPELIEDDISQTDRTIDSTSMPEEVVTPKEIIKEVKVQEIPTDKAPIIEENKPVVEKVDVKDVEIQEVKPTATIDTQTGKSLILSTPSVSDKSVICQPDIKTTHDVSITCAPPQEIEVQTSEPHSEEKEVLESIQIRQTISDGHETIEIASRPVVREQKLDEQSLLVNANYQDSNILKDSQLNIIHSLPQSFETVMTEPDETTTEVVVDADGTKRIIVRKVRKTLVTRQQTVQTQQQRSQILSSENIPQDQSFSQITLQEDKGETSTTLDDGGVQHIQYQTYGGQILSGLPGREMTIQEFTSKPDMIIRMEHGMKPEEILQLTEGEIEPQIQTSSSSVTAVVQQVTKRIIKTKRRIIRRVVIIDGKEHVTEEVIEEPDNVEVFEEQIPRVSISVKDQSGVQFEEIDDSKGDGKDDQSPALPPDSAKDTGSRESKPTDDNRKSPKDSQKSTEKPLDYFSPTETQALQGMLKEFMEKESQYSPQSQPVTVTADDCEKTPVQTSFETVFVDEPQVYEQTYRIQEPQDGQTILLTGGAQYSTVESSSNVATVVQKITRKITRTRKRIIKHIQIIDGKEHVTEEVIEEPDDVEIIEEEPIMSHNIQTHGIKTKRVKIIRQVQIIDGKEHVTEQVIEEPDDEYIPETTVTAEIDVNINKPVTILKNNDEKVDQINVNKDTPVTDLTVKESRAKTSPIVTDEATDTALTTSSKAMLTNIVATIPDSSEKYNTSLVDVTKAFLGSETDHSTILGSPTVETIKQTTSDNNILITAEPSTVIETTLPITVTSEMVQETNTLIPETVTIPTITEATSIKFEDKTVPLSEEITAEKVPSEIVTLTDTSKDISMKPPAFAVSTVPITDVTQSPQELLQKEQSQTILIHETIRTPEIETDETILHKNPEDKGISTVESILETSLRVTKESPKTEQYKISQTQAETSPILSSVEVEPLKIGTIISETDVKNVPGLSELSYIQQFDSKTTGSTESVDKVVIPIHPQTSFDTNVMPTDFVEKETSGSNKEDTKYDINTLLEAERQDTHLRGFSDKPNPGETDVSQETTSATENRLQTVDMSMSLVKTQQLNETKPEVQFDIKVEGFEAEPIVVKKDVTVILPLDVKITEEHIQTPAVDLVKKEHPVISEIIPDESIKEHKRSKKRKKNKRGSEDSDSISIEIPVEIEKVKTDSSVVTTKVTENPLQTVDISMSLTKTHEIKEIKPEVQFDIKVEGFESGSTVVKKDIIVNLPLDIKITEEHIQTPTENLVELEQPVISEAVTIEPIKEQKVSKKKKKNKRGSEDSDSITTEIPVETDKSVTESESTSLSHYVELPTSPPIESPKPTQEILEPIIETSRTELQPESPIIESESVTEEIGYEPEDVSMGPIVTPDKKKKQKKRKQHGVSEETTYPKLSTTDSDETSLTSPKETAEPSTQKKSKDKKRKKKTKSGTSIDSDLDIDNKPEEKLESPKVGSEILETSPKQESYHTMSEASDNATVKIIEECVQSSPETLQKEVTTTITYPVPVVEEITTQEYSIQTSPEVSLEQRKEEIERPETVDIVQQTSPTPLSESLVQTTPVEDKEAHTQTIEDITVVEKVPISDSEIQTSRTETPELLQSEVTTQVIAYDICAPEEKFSQTSSPIEETKLEEKVEDIPPITTECREIQTSPLPLVQKDEKSTEIIIETSDTDIQTIKKEIIDQETSTSPVKDKDLTEMSMQTPEIPLVSSFTQSDEPMPEEFKVEEKLTVITTESAQQTSPTESPEESLKLELTKPEVIDSTQQTSPRIEEIEQPREMEPFEITKTEVITTDNTQQTSPREEVAEKPQEPEVIPIKTEVVTIDTTQQTSPREVVAKAISPDLELIRTEIITVDNTQQTSPREDEPKTPESESVKANVLTVDSVQQTTPRNEITPSAPRPSLPELELVKNEVLTIDATQQTTPRGYSEDSISTSTDEPYEVHLRAQISIPQTTDDFIANERNEQEKSQSIVGEKHKQKKKKHKKKTESPTIHSPESLSDPITTELSMSVTPTSDDLSSKDPSSIDEGISQMVSPVVPKRYENNIPHQSKLTYSDVVQRSKSKSPSPSKITAQKSEKARLLDALEKRTQSVSAPPKPVTDNSMALVLYEPGVEKSYDLIVNKEIDEVREAAENNDTSRVERSVIVVIETISIWLEEIQYKIQRETASGIIEVDENERLTSIQSYIRKLKEIIEITEINEEITTLIETLTQQVNAVNTLNKQSSTKVQENEYEWNKFLDETEKLKQSVNQVKSKLDDIILSDISSQQKLDKLDKIELNNSDNSDNVKKLFRKFKVLAESNPKQECPENLYISDDDIKHIENVINTERDRLLQLTSLVEEYEQTLQDFGQITDVAEALLDGKIIVSNLDHLHEEIQKHRKFFVNLSHCRAILESLEDNLDSETKSKYSSLHNSLHDRATLIIDRAASRAQQMTLAASKWTTLEQGMKAEKQWLVVAQQRVPDLTNVTSMDHEQYINLYQSLTLDVSHHYAKMLRLLSITESLQNLIICSGLETECSVALDTLLKLQEDVDSKLTRLTAFKENWLMYDHLIDRIEGWIRLANRELEIITPENISTSGHLRRFWELKAQHEVHNNLKNESGIQFEKALEILPISDEMVQRQFFSKIEDKWRDLAAKIDVIHVTAIQNISDRDVTSGEKLNILEEEIRELRASLDGLKGVIKSEDELNLYIERLQVMTGRMDRIQNELGRLSLLPTAESERLGALLTQSGILDDLISEELERSLLLKEKIVQVQAGILRCQKSQRRARLTLEECESAERLGSDVVERASENCERLLEDLASQWRDILALRQALHTLPTSLRVCVSPTGVERDISALQETHAELEAACNELSARLRAKVQLWRRFERQLELVQGAVREADYMVELLTVQGQVDYDRLLKATEKLETLSESLSRRSGELVGELKDAAAPLEASTEPSVAAQLRRELDDAAAAYEHTCSNLTQLCDKYHKAVELWKRYRDAAAAVRTFAEFMEGRLHSLRPDDAPATAQACLEQESRVAELRSLAARVAAETGSRALQTDADALARRLQLVAGAVQVLADLGEARQLARAKALQAKEKLCDMRQDLAPLHEDGEIVEDKLIALRDNLIALGKSEADIAPGKAELPEIDRDISDEHSIVRILELWQAMFRDTFLHYHRLSTALVRSGDAATALKLWHEYLLDLQSFLSGSVPADYENLTEHRRLCRVHRNLLTSQRSVLMNENRDLRNRELSDRFDMMTNLHNETLSRIVERHDEVCTRIAAWDDYREINTELLRWLKQMEREKEKLQLRYVHMKTIHKILAKIQNLSDKVPEGRKQSEKLLTNLKKVLEFTEETYGASVRIEYAGVVKRVDNLQASLDTWRDFLSRILALIGEYETLTNDLNKLFSKTQNEINSYSDEQRLSRPQLKKAIDKYTELRKKIEKTETQLEALSVIQEQLKECLSPQDIRIVNQRIWQLRQQRADLEHQLSIIIYRLQERLEVYTLFDSRLTRFAEWITTLESKLEISSQNGEVGALDPQDLIRRINSDVQAETSLKEREFEWLVETGNALIDLSKKDEKSYSKNTSKQLKDVQERWQKLQETGRSRIAKINELLETISQLEERLTEIRLKLHTIESQLSTTVVLEHLTSKAVDEKFKDRDDIQKNIESESSEVGETLNYCQLIFNDPDIVKGNFDLRNLKTGVDIVEKKWKNICDMSEHRKNALKEIRKSAELANSLLPKVEKKLDSIEKRVEKIETRKQRGESEDESVTKSVLKDLEALESDIKKLEDAYSRVASTRGIELRGAGADDAARLRGAVRRWQQLRVRVDAAGADAHRQFVAAHGKAVVTLAEADVRLTRALHLAPTPQDKVATLQELDGVEEELRECEALVEDADRLSAAVSTVSGVPDMVAEYRALYADVKTRLDLARAEVLGDVAIQVDTLTWETDVALQVDTLTSKETYRVELASAVREASDALEALRTALLQQPKENASGDELATAAKEIAKAGAKPGQTLELAKHLSELLLTECDATEDEALLKEVESLSMRYEDLLAQAKKRELQINNLRLPHSASYALTCEHEAGRLTCPLCSERNWKQLDNDLWRLEQWLQFAEATQAARTDPPEQYDALEDAIQDHREFLLDLDSHKSIVVSLNVVGSHVAQHAESPARADKVRARLAAANARWDAACEHAGVWQKRLQRALVHNQQFHDIVVELVARLASAERGVRSREPLRLTRPAEELQRDFRRFSELRDELSRAEPRVLALHESAQLLRAGDAPAHADDICRRLGELRLRLQSLRKLSGVYALKLGAALARQPARASALAAIASAAAPQLMEEEEGQISTSNLPPLDENDVVLTDETEDQELSRLQRGLRFVCRVAKASIPFQALLLLLLGAAALAPHAHSDCRSSGLALEPVLRYPEGPPPL